MATATATKRFTSRDLFAANQELLSVKRTAPKTTSQDVEPMPRIRTIKPEFFESTTVAKLDRPARLMFIACINWCDDEGRLRWNPSHLKSVAFPYDDDITANHVAEWMDQIAKCRLVIPYSVSGTSYGEIRGFAEHQVINRKSKPKYPPRQKGDTHGVLSEGSLHTQYTSHQETEGKGNGRETEGKHLSSKSKDDFDGVGAFDEFWKHVHRKVGKQVAKTEVAKAVASAAKEKSIPKATAAKLITEAMKAFAQSPSATPKDHTPIHPSNWLKQGRYDDDRDAWQGNTAKPDPGKRFDPNFDYALGWK